MANIIKINGAGWASNCYIVKSDTDAVIIDPGGDYKAIIEHLEGRKLRAILATHGHYDHIGNVTRLKQDHNVSFHVHAKDRTLVKHANFYLNFIQKGESIDVPSVDAVVSDLDILDFGFVQIKVIHTPGHTEGSVCYIVHDNLLTGDTLMKDSVGRTDLPGGNTAKIRDSIRKICTSFTDISILPGHGENTTLAAERNANTWLVKILDEH